jgi:hypothetical protein
LCGVAEAGQFTTEMIKVLPQRVPRRACGGWRSPTTETDPARVTGP